MKKMGHVDRFVIEVEITCSRKRVQLTETKETRLLSFPIRAGPASKLKLLPPKMS